MPQRTDPFGASLIGERIAGRYVVDRVLGAGAMGIVVAARHPELGQSVAIKFLRPDLAQNRSIAGRFLREARLSATVQSPNLVRVYDVGTHQGVSPYIVMELLSGHSLGAELEANGRLPVEVASDVVVQCAAGLAELHARGVVHRDIKPANIFVTRAAGVRTIKVLDFGISKERPTPMPSLQSGAADDEEAAPLTVSHSILGTPQYMAPEQVRDPRSVDARSDVWSLGVVLYQLLTNVLPFVPGDNGLGEVFGLILFQDPTPPRTLVPSLPKELEHVVMRCLCRDRDARYASVGALADALAPFLAPSSQHRVELVHRALSTSEHPPPLQDGRDREARGLALAQTELSAAEQREDSKGWFEVVGSKEASAIPAEAAADSLSGMSGIAATGAGAPAPLPWRIPRRFVAASAAMALMLSVAATLSVATLWNRDAQGVRNALPGNLGARSLASAPRGANAKSAAVGSARLSCSAPMPGAASDDCVPTSLESGSANTRVELQDASLLVRAYVDGRSRLVLRGSSVRWRHMDWSAPGRWRGADEPTTLNDTLWVPAWPDRSLGRENKDCNCESSSFPLSPMLAAPSVGATVVKRAGRGPVEIVQQPLPINGLELVVEIMDPAEGADWYEFIVSYPTRG